MTRVGQEHVDPNAFRVKRRLAVDQTWHCAACGTTLEGLPFALHVTCPALWTDEAAQHPESELLSEQCVIAGDRFFLCGILVLPVLDAEPDLEWTIWVQLPLDAFREAAGATLRGSQRRGESAALVLVDAEADFLSRCRRWFVQGRENDPPVPAHLTVTLPGYANTIDTPGLLHTRPLGLRALFTPTDPSHTHTRDHSAGISQSQVHALAHASH